MHKKEIKIDFFALGQDQKQQYLKFLVEQSMDLQEKDKNQFIAYLKPQNKNNKSIEYSDKKQSSQSKNDKTKREFTPASKRKNYMFQIETRKQAVEKSPRNLRSSVSPIKQNYKPKTCNENYDQLNGKFYDIQQNYPYIACQIKNIEILTRPIKIKSNEFFKLIEEIYHKRFQESTIEVRKNRGLIKENNFQIFVMEFLKHKYSKQKQVNQLIINFLGSIDLYAPKSQEVDIFRQFLKLAQGEEILIFLLFTRAVIQRKLVLQFHNPFKKEAIDLSITLVPQQHLMACINTIFGHQDNATRQIFFNELKQKSQQKIPNQLSITDFCQCAILHYQRYKDFQPQQSQNQQCVEEIKIYNDEIQKLNQSNEFIKENDENDNEDHFNYDNILARIKSGESDTQLPSEQDNTSNVTEEIFQVSFKKPCFINSNSFKENESQNQNIAQTLNVLKDFNEEKFFFQKSSNNCKKEYIPRQEVSEKQPQVQHLFTNPLSDQINEEKDKHYHSQTKFALSKLKQLSKPNCLESLIIDSLEEQISDFVEEMLADANGISEDQKEKCRKDVELKIQDVVSSLLESIYKFDKMIWFQKFQKQPEEQHLIYIESIQKQYRKLKKSPYQNIEPNEIKQICSQLMQTPDLAKQIGNALISFFEQS